MRRTTAIIADDEPRLALYLRDRLAALWPELVVAGVAENGPAAVALLRDEAPDIAFLDIRMPGMSGLAVARDAPAGTHVVFVTAFDQYALEAFEHAAIDYLRKPVTDERLAATITRLKARVEVPAQASELQAALSVLARLTGAMGGGGAVPAEIGGGALAGERLAWIRALVGDVVRLISVDDVCYFQSNDKYTSVFTAEGEALIRTPLKELGGQLDPARFWQVHRGTIVNLAHVEATARDFAGRVSLRLKSRPEAVLVSRAYAHRFRQM